MKILLCLISTFAIWASAIAATPSSIGKTGTPPPPVAAHSISQLELELKVLQTQAATMKEYHSSLLDTVYWALGTVATVAVLLVGFGWFANFKFHESEKQRLKEELEARLREATATINARLGSHEIEVLNSIDSRLDGHLTRIARDIDIARAEASRFNQENADAVKELKADFALLQKTATNTARRDDELETALRLVEENVWELKGIPTNTLITQGQGLRSAVKAGNHYFITSALGRMQSTIKNSVLPNKDGDVEVDARYDRLVA